MLEVIKEYGRVGLLTHFPNMLKQKLEKLEAKGVELSNAMSDEMKEGQTIVQEKFLVALMLSRASGSKYNDLKKGMKENFLTGTSTYSKSPKAVLRILNEDQPPMGWNKHRQDAGAGTGEGAIFAQTKSGNNLWKARLTCHACGKKGYIPGEGPNNKRSKKQELMHTNIQV
jgi:hypothetical protein